MSPLQARGPVRRPRPAEFHYIVVGAGTAGCVAAARLSQDPGVRVLLLEAGSAQRTRAMTVPNAWPENLGSAADWADVTTSQADAGPVAYPRGRALGGRSGCSRSATCGAASSRSR
ncbi:MAG TPA: NAD(P)-binding protein [Streptosporangiaceae bacterium]|nr:NAD(P)-binding protein [Streptosporangiaceae bacterium]